MSASTSNTSGEGSATPFSLPPTPDLVHGPLPPPPNAPPPPLLAPLQMWNPPLLPRLAPSPAASRMPTTMVSPQIAIPLTPMYAGAPVPLGVGGPPPPFGPPGSSEASTPYMPFYNPYSRLPPGYTQPASPFPLASVGGGFPRYTVPPVIPPHPVKRKYGTATKPIEGSSKRRKVNNTAQSPSVAPPPPPPPPRQYKAFVQVMDIPTGPIPLSSLPPPRSRKVPGQAPKRQAPVTKDIPSDLAEQPIDTLWTEVFDDSQQTWAAPADSIGGPMEFTWSITDPSSFDEHGKEHTLPSNNSTFKCNICDHRFLKKHTVINHIKTHLGQKSFVCTAEGCTLAFVRDHDLRRHLKTHSGVKPYICDCGKEFTRLDALRRHTTIGRCELRNPRKAKTPKAPKVVVKAEVDDNGRPVGDVEPESVPKSKRPRGRPRKSVPSKEFVIDGGSSLSSLEPEDNNQGLWEVETEDENAPSSFLFAIPGLHTQEMIDRVRGGSTVSSPLSDPPPLSIAPLSPPPLPEIPFITPFDDPPPLEVTLIVTDPHASITAHLEREAFPAEKLVSSTDMAFGCFALNSISVEPPMMSLTDEARDIEEENDSDEWSDDEDESTEHSPEPLLTSEPLVPSSPTSLDSIMARFMNVPMDTPPPESGPPAPMASTTA